MRKLANISQFEAMQDKANRDMGLVSEMSVFNKMDYDGIVEIFVNSLRHMLMTGEFQDNRLVIAKKAVDSFMELTPLMKNYNEFLEILQSDCDILKKRIAEGLLKVKTDMNIGNNSEDAKKRTMAKLIDTLTNVVDSLQEFMIHHLGESVMDGIHARQVNFPHWMNYIMDAWHKSGRDVVIAGHELGEDFAKSFIDNNPRLVDVDDKLYGFNDDLAVVKKGFKMVTLHDMEEMIKKEHPEMDDDRKQRLLSAMSDDIDAMLNEAQKSGEEYIRSNS